MNASDNDDGGPAFPVSEEDSRGKVAGVYGGMSKRDLFAAILMHSEAVTCGVPGEACDALVEAAERHGRGVIDHMASNAVEGADALLHALAEPKPVQYRELYVDERMRLQAAERLAAVAEDLKQQPAYAQLPENLRALLESAATEITEPPLPF